MSNTAPLTPGQLWALSRATTRELLWGLRAGSHEIERWRRYACTIPDPSIRRDALYALDNKRHHAHGAGLFWVLTRRRNHDLLRLLVAYELIWDLLDNLSERAAAGGYNDQRQLHNAIAEAIDPGAPISDYLAHHPQRRDGGYLRALVKTCQERCRRLPSYDNVRELALREARRAQVLGLNHLTDPARRDAELRGWVAREHPHGLQASWWELSGAASAPLTILALLALAADTPTPSEVASAHAAYSPWLSAATTMLDSYVDQRDDHANGDHSYVAHYPDAESARNGIQALVMRSVGEARSLANGHMHAVIAAAMIAMYLSKTGASAPTLRPGTLSFVRAGGSLTRLLLPVLRAWRIAYSQRSA